MYCLYVYVLPSSHEFHFRIKHSRRRNTSFLHPPRWPGFFQNISDRHEKLIVWVVIFLWQSYDFAEKSYTNMILSFDPLMIRKTSD